MWRKRVREIYIYIYGVPRYRRHFEFSAAGDYLCPNIYGPRDKVVRTYFTSFEYWMREQFGRVFRARDQIL